MNLDSVKSTTLIVLSRTSEDEIATVTLPALREKVAEAMEIPIEELLGKDIKAVILETFQDFLLSQSRKEAKESEADEEDEDFVEEEPAPVKKAKTEKKSSKDIKAVEFKPVESKSVESDTSEAIRVKADTVVKSYSRPKASESPTVTSSSAKSAQIEKLKSYVFKCGVRKVWKKELEGLNENQSIAKIQGILRELGIEGKPSLEQCKAIKERREFEAELREIDASNIIEGKRRSSTKEIVFKKTDRVVESEDNESDESERGAELTQKISTNVTGKKTGRVIESYSESEDTGIEIDLTALGDSESD